MATASVTNTFTNATPADADEVNTNFSDLVAFINTNLIQKDGSKAMTGALDAGSQKVVNLATPTEDTDAATKLYVDTIAAIAAGSVDTAQLADGAVETAKIATDAVTSAKIADDAINNNMIVADAVQTTQIKDSAVTFPKISGSDAGGSLASGAVEYVKILGWVFVNINNATSSPNIATLPSGFRPSATINFRSTISSGLVDCTISTGGVISGGGFFSGHQATIAFPV